MVSYFVIGVYDSRYGDEWPWHIHYERGRYLSASKRQCNVTRKAVFSSKKSALKFWFEYKNIHNLSFEIIEFITDFPPKDLQP